MCSKIYMVVESDGLCEKVDERGLADGGIMASLGTDNTDPAGIALNSISEPNSTCWITGNLARIYI